MAEKINNAEVMTEEQLEQVVGGALGESLNDATILHRVGLLNTKITKNDIVSNPEQCFDLIKVAWARIGIYCEFDKLGRNVYYDRDGTTTTREIARKRAENWVNGSNE